MKIVRAMELLTILNHCHRHRGFVYQHARFGPDHKSIEVAVRPREGSAAVCSGCHQPAPGYDRLPERALWRLRSVRADAPGSMACFGLSLLVDGRACR